MHLGIRQGAKLEVMHLQQFMFPLKYSNISVISHFTLNHIQAKIVADILIPRLHLSVPLNYCGMYGLFHNTKLRNYFLIQLRKLSTPLR